MSKTVKQATYGQDCRKVIDIKTKLVYAGPLAFGKLRNRVWMRIKAIALVGLTVPLVSYGQLNMTGGVSSIEDPILLGDGRFEDYKTGTASTQRLLTTRAPTSDEQKLIEQMERLISNSRTKTIALIDKQEVVWIGYREPYLKHERLLSMSISKSIVAVATGIAVCNKKVNLEDRVDSIFKELSGKDLGLATVKDLLTMTSGAWGGNPDSTIFDSQQRLKLATGTIGLKDILLSEQVSRAHRNNVFSAKRKPGEVFAYRSTDPLVLARILEIVASETYGQFIEANILKPAGISNSAISGRDFFGFPRADGVLRLTLEDWIRVAIWIQEQRKRTDCLGGFLLTATQRQVDNRTGSNFPQAFKSYGYYFGLNNENVQDSFWAVGFGGQRIGWSTIDEKIIITFSNSDAHIKDLELLFNQWITQEK